MNVMKNTELLKGLSIEELQERNEFTTVATVEDKPCCDHFDPTPPCCFPGS